ncbi:hypothetical protein EB796_015536 [Bugula neritina]|uniref:Uncharacterized protein n=1 Tax=Bugula neritina TaxID=10212 RepID=A0A7J7JIL6_BUGNE|nr:hypothetical protein EB796_015536 [Bugula neritina]
MASQLSTTTLSNLLLTTTALYTTSTNFPLPTQSTNLTNTSIVYNTGHVKNTTTRAMLDTTTETKVVTSYQLTNLPQSSQSTLQTYISTAKATTIKMLDGTANIKAITTTGSKLASELIPAVVGGLVAVAVLVSISELLALY